MSKLAVGLLIAGFAAVPFVDQTPQKEMKVTSYGDAQAATLATNQSVYFLRSSTGASCRILVEAGPGNQKVVKADSFCSDVQENLDQVSSWISDGRGGDILADAKGQPVLALSASDGFAYEAVGANGAQISFSFSDI